MPLTENLMKPQKVAEHLGVEVNTLATWRTLGNRSLPWVKVGSAVRYRESDVNQFIRDNLQNPEGESYE